MTVREKFQSKLTDIGISEEDASEIIDLSIPLIEKAYEEYGYGAITWDDPADNYPRGFYVELFINVQQTALEWLDKRTFIK